MQLALRSRFEKLSGDIDKHEIFLIAGSIAHTTALALAPFILILLSLTSFLNTDMQQKIFAQITSAIGNGSASAVQSVIENTEKSPKLTGLSGIIGFVIILISASAIFSQLRVALDKINDYQPAANTSGWKAFVKDRFLSVGLVLGFAFLSIVSLIASVVLSVSFQYGGQGLWQVLSLAVNLLLFSLLFAAIYRFVPSQTQSYRKCAVAGFVSTLFYLIGKSLIGIYLAKAGLESAYGAAGSLVVFLAWVYYTALTLLVSYEFTNHLILPELGRQSCA